MNLLSAFYGFLADFKMIFELHFDLATRGKALALKFDFAEDSQFSMRPS